MMHWQLNPSLSKHSHINLKNYPPGGDDKDINCYCCQPNHQQGELLRKMDPINNKGREFFCCPKPPDEHSGYFKWDNEGGEKKQGKCGLCHEPGHTQAKCPMKSDSS